MPKVKIFGVLKEVLGNVCINDNEIIANNLSLLNDIDLQKYHQIMINMGGNKKSDNTYIFPFNPIILYEKLLAGGDTNIANKYNYYPTHDNVAKEYLIKGIDFSNKKALEPSAGDGVIARLMRDNGADVHCVELMQEMREALLLQDFKLIGSDFMLLPLSYQFDIILANPPFFNYSDIKHIQKMYLHLKENGIIRAIMSELNYNSNNNTSLSFRQWIAQVGSVTFLGKGLFLHLGTDVSTVLIEIRK